MLVRYSSKYLLVERHNSAHSHVVRLLHFHCIVSVMKSPSFILSNLYRQPPPRPIGEVGYKIRYSPECSDGTPPPDQCFATFGNRNGINAMDIMEAAVNQGGTPYRFSATYFGSFLGYFIDVLNGTASASPCYWAVLYELSNGTEVLADVGVTNLRIYNKQSLLMQYQTFEHSWK